jgi:iron only hydrogenase large subunit-like protein
MSKIFYDHLIDLGSVEKRVKRIAKTSDEREELYHLIDDIVHHRVLGCIFENLSESEHKNFVSEFKKRPHDKNLISYLQERVRVDIEEFIRMEIHALATELLQLVTDSTKPKSLRH